MKIVCLLKGIFTSLIHFNIISGHEYQEIYNNKDVQILKCIKCNHYSIGFKEEISKYEYNKFKIKKL